MSVSCAGRLSRALGRPKSSSLNSIMPGIRCKRKWLPIWKCFTSSRSGGSMWGSRRGSTLKLSLALTFRSRGSISACCTGDRSPRKPISRLKPSFNRFSKDARTPLKFYLRWAMIFTWGRAKIMVSLTWWVFSSSLWTNSRTIMAKCYPRNCGSESTSWRGLTNQSSSSFLKSKRGVTNTGSDSYGCTNLSEGGSN